MFPDCNFYSPRQDFSRISLMIWLMDWFTCWWTGFFLDISLIWLMDWFTNWYTWHSFMISLNGFVYFSHMINGLVHLLIYAAFSHYQLKWIGLHVFIKGFLDIPFPQAGFLMFKSELFLWIFPFFPLSLLEFFTWSLTTGWWTRLQQIKECEM